MIAILIGGTGLTGSLLLQQLLADPALTQVISVSRKPLKLSNAKLTEILVADLAQLPSVQARLRGDLYFCCLGTTLKAAGSQQNFEKVDHAAIAAFARIAKAHDAKSLTLVSAMGADAASVIFYNRVKGRTEADVKALGLRPLIIFQPALLVGPRQDFRLAEKVVARTLVPLMQLLPAGAARRLLTPADTLDGACSPRARPPQRAPGSLRPRTSEKLSLQRLPPRLIHLPAGRPPRRAPPARRSTHPA